MRLCSVDSLRCGPAIGCGPVSVEIGNICPGVDESLYCKGSLYDPRYELCQRATGQKGGAAGMSYQLGLLSGSLTCFEGTVEAPRNTGGCSIHSSKCDLHLYDRRATTQLPNSSQSCRATSAGFLSTPRSKKCVSQPASCSISLARRQCRSVERAHTP